MDGIRHIEESLPASAAEVKLANEFYAHYAELQESLPRFIKDAQGHGYKYAPLNAILGQLKPVLAKHGFVVRFRTWSPTADSFGVRCVLRHVSGWSETSEIIARPNEVGGRMSGAQQRGALQTYLQRYTLLAVLGTTADVDTDAAGDPEKAPDAPHKAEGSPPPTLVYQSAGAAPAPAEAVHGGVDSDGIPF